MSLDEIEYASHALRTLFDVTFCDADDKQLSWTKGLVQSTNIPEATFSVESQKAGTTKGYSDFLLPESLSISMYETTRHMVERYLTDWQNAIFDFKKSCFKTPTKYSEIYRQIFVRTMFYEVTTDGKQSHVPADLSKAVELTVNTVVDQMAGKDVSLRLHEYISEYSKTIFDRIVNQENAIAATHVPVKTQAAPVLDKITALISGIANQVIASVPLSDLTSRFIAPVIVPPRLLTLPGTPQVTLPKKVQAPIMGLPHNPAIEKEVFKRVTEVAKNSAPLQKVLNHVNDILNDLPNSKSVEKTTSTHTYRVALASYDIGTYSYTTGEAVTYNLELPVVDRDKEIFK